MDEVMGRPGQTVADGIASDSLRGLLQGYLASRRWFASKNERLHGVAIVDTVPLPGAPDIQLMEIEADLGTRRERYLLPLGIAPAGDPDDLPTRLALAEIQGTDGKDLLTDAFALEGLARAVMVGLRTRASADSPAGRIEWRPTSLGSTLPDTASETIRWLSAEQSNSSLLVGRTAMVKLIRRVLPGIHPEAEMTRHLTDLGYTGTAALLGEVVRIGPDGTPYTLVIVQGAVDNRGDAWTWALEQLAAGEGAAVIRFCAAVGRRLGELHVALGRPDVDPAFAPVTAGEAEVAALIEGANEQVDTALDGLSRARAGLAGEAATLAIAVLALRAGIAPALASLAEAARGTALTRAHGDFHLGQILVTGDDHSPDAVIIDFEGEPLRSLDQRRAKGTPLRDVAGFLRSLDYLAATAGRAGSPAFDPHAAETAVLDAYRTHGPTLPDAARQNLLDLMLLEKAAYEISYEAANRPAWLPIPLRGFSTLVERLTGRESAP